MKGLNLLSYWQRFWFGKQPATPIAIFRILFGLIVLQNLLIELAPNFLYFYGIKAILDSPTVVTYWWRNQPQFDLFLLGPQTDTFHIIIFAFIVTAALFMTLGLFTRASTVLLYLGLLSLQRHCPLNFDGGDLFMRLCALILCFSHAGDAFSLDNLIKQARQSESQQAHQPALSQPWAQRLLQVQLSLVYFHSFLCKIQGVCWQKGLAIYWSTRFADLIRFPCPPLTDTLLGSQIGTYFTLVIEFLLFTLVWFKPLRYWILLGGVILHLGIDWCMNLPGFETLFIAAYVNFIDPADLEKALDWLNALLGRILGAPIRLGFFAQCLSDIDQKKALPAYVQKKTVEQLSSSDPILEAESLTRKPWIKQSRPFLRALLVPIFFLFVVLAIFPERWRLINFENTRNVDRRLSIDENKWVGELQHLGKLPVSDQRQLNALDQLASALTEKRQFAQAEKIYKITYEQRLAQAIQPYDEKLIKTMLNLAQTYADQGQFGKAEQVYKSIWAYDKAALGKYDAKIARDLNNLGAITYLMAMVTTDSLERQLVLTRANSLLLQARLAYRQVLNYDIQNAANTLDSEYLVLRELGNARAAEGVKAEAEKVHKQVLGRIVPP